MARKNVLMIVVDQWRADFVPHLMRARGETRAQAEATLRACGGILRSAIG